MNAADLHTLLDYHYWARDRLLAAVETLTPEQFDRDLGSSFPSIRETLGHLFFAEWAWHERMQGRSPTGPPVSAFDTVADLRKSWLALEENVRTYLSSLGAEVDRVFEYKTLSGHAGASPVWQILQHVVNHGSYHRGQITTMLRQLGAKAPDPMDLIAYHRVKGRRSN